MMVKDGPGAAGNVVEVVMATGNECRRRKSAQGASQPSSALHQGNTFPRPCGAAAGRPDASYTPPAPSK